MGSAGAVRKRVAISASQTRHRIPGLGHWTKIACGHTIPRSPLPQVENPPLLIRQIREPETPVLPEDAPELERIERLATTATPSVTKAMLVHPLVEKTRAALTGARTNNQGKLWASQELEWLDLRITKGCLTRALQIMAALIQILEREGFKLVVEKKAAESTSAIVYGEKIRFGLIERSRQVKPAPKPSGSSPYPYDSIRLEPTGILSIEVWNYYSGGPQKVWRDRESAKLEEQLPRCLAGMMRIALVQRAHREAREKEDLARQKKIDEVAAELEKIEAEEKKIRVLQKEATAWHCAERIRKYVAVARESGVKNAECLDPLKPTPASIVDDKEKVLRRLHSAESWWHAEPLPEEDA